MNTQILLAKAADNIRRCIESELQGISVSTGLTVSDMHIHLPGCGPTTTEVVLNTRTTSDDFDESEGSAV